LPVHKPRCGCRRVVELRRELLSDRPFLPALTANVEHDRLKPTAKNYTIESSSIGVLLESPRCYSSLLPEDSGLGLSRSKWLNFGIELRVARSELGIRASVRLMKSVVAFAFLASCTASDQTGLVEQPILAGADSGAVAVAGDFDGDGCTDISVKATTGIWYIDMCSNGFGGAWDYAYPGYGGSDSVPVPADYDGDGLTDLAVKDSTGFWGIDYAWNGFGKWDVMSYGYGNAAAIAVPADYDGDGMADMSVKDASGMWGIDFASNGFVGWNDVQYGYGSGDWVPVPAKYDSDAKADRAIKTNAGDWYIDDSSNGFGGKLCTRCLAGNWDHHYTGYGNASAVPEPADYDNDGHADLSVNTLGTWFFDFWAPSYSFGAWDWPNTGYPQHGNSTSKMVPGDYDHDGHTDLAWKDNVTGYWYIDYQRNGWATTAPYYDQAIPTVRQMYDANMPYIFSTIVYGPDGSPVTVANGQSQLSIGVRYTADVTIQPGHPSSAYTAGTELNPSLHVPASLNVLDGGFSAPGALPTGSCTANSTCASGDCNATTHQCNSHRRYALTCSDFGSFPLGFEMRDIGAPVGTGNAFNPDYGIQINCASSTGVYGRVTRRTYTNGIYTPGTQALAATVTAVGYPAVSTDANGYWQIPSAVGGPLSITVDAGPTFSKTKVNNVSVPTGHGVEIDTPMEETFVLPSNATYTQYIDYSRGRTILHTVDIDTRYASIKTDLPSKNASGDFNTLLQVASDLGANANVVVNGSYFVPAGEAGYFYSITAAPSTFGYVQSFYPDGSPGLAPPSDTAAQSPSISVSLPRYGTGFPIPVTFGGLPGPAVDKIALAPAGSPVLTLTSSVYAQKIDGTYTFGAVTDGQYVARVVENGTLLAESASFTVGRASAASVASDSTYYTYKPVGVSVLVSFVGPIGGSIVIVDPNSPGTVLASTTVSSANPVALTVPAAGTFEVRILMGGTFLANSSTFRIAAPLEAALTAPLLAINGTATNQHVWIAQGTPSNFGSTADPWTQHNSFFPFYDHSPRDGVSDISFGFQCWPVLLASGGVISGSNVDSAWARTTGGVSPNHLFLVVADGEGVMGGNGATLNQLGEFYRDVLGATDAMNFDGGLSTEMVLVGTSSGRRHVNTLTGEDGTIQINPYSGHLVEAAGTFGTVNNLVRVGP